MLTLTRRLDERIILTDIATNKQLGIIQIVDIFRRRVRLAFDCPSTVRIDREEIYRRRQSDELSRCDTSPPTQDHSSHSNSTSTILYRPSRHGARK